MSLRTEKAWCLAHPAEGFLWAYMADTRRGVLAGRGEDKWPEWRKQGYRIVRVEVREVRPRPRRRKERAG